VTASAGSSILPFGSLGDPFGLEYKIPTHSKTVATIATKPITIPQYTHDIHHPLACELRESFPEMPSCCQTIYPLGCLVFHFGKCFGFSAPSSQRKSPKEDSHKHEAGDTQIAHWNFRPGRRFSGGDCCAFGMGFDCCQQRQAICLCLRANGGQHEACQLLLLCSPNLFRSCLGLGHMENSSAQLFLDRARPPTMILDCVHNSVPKSRLPCGGKFVIKAFSVGFGCANHVGVVLRKILISRQHAISNTTRGEIHNRSSHGILDSSHMVAGTVL
jgi:hypothetical protein